MNTKNEYIRAVILSSILEAWGHYPGKDSDFFTFDDIVLMFSERFLTGHNATHNASLVTLLQTAMEPLSVLQAEVSIMKPLNALSWDYPSVTLRLFRQEQSDDSLYYEIVLAYSSRRGYAPCKSMQIGIKLPDSDAQHGLWVIDSYITRGL